MMKITTICIVVTMMRLTQGSDDLQRAIMEIDANRDNHIQMQELYLLVKELHTENLQDELVDIYREVDRNADGLVTWTEYMHSCSHEKNNHTELNITDENFEIDHLIFDAADKDYSTSLDFAEFFHFVYPEKDSYMIHLLYKNCLMKYDLNNDSFISFTEYIDKKKYHEDAVLNMDTYLHLFNNVYDKNTDGLLVKEEVLEWICPGWNWKNAVDESVKSLFSRITANPFVGTTYAEIRDNLQVIATVAIAMKKVQRHDEL